MPVGICNLNLGMEPRQRYISFSIGTFPELDVPLSRLPEPHQTGKKNRLTLQDVGPRLGYAEPPGTVKFGKPLCLSGFRRPLHFEHVAFERSRIPVLFHRPDINDLAAWLRRRTERQRLPARAVPVPSWNSRFAAARGDSPSPIRPLGIDHDPGSLLRQKSLRDDRAAPRPRRPYGGRAKGQRFVWLLRLFSRSHPRPREIRFFDKVPNGEGALEVRKTYRR